MRGYHYSKQELNEKLEGHKIPFWGKMSDIADYESGLPIPVLVIYFLIFFVGVLASAVVSSTSIGIADQSSFIKNFFFFAFMTYVLYFLFARTELVSAFVSFVPAWFIASDFLVQRIYHVDEIEELTLNQYIFVYLIGFIAVFLVAKLFTYYKKHGPIKHVYFIHDECRMFPMFVLEVVMGMAIAAYGTLSGYIFAQNYDEKTFYTFKELYDIITEDYMGDFIRLTIIYSIPVLIIGWVVNRMYYKRYYVDGYEYKRVEDKLQEKRDERDQQIENRRIRAELELRADNPYATVSRGEVMTDEDKKDVELTADEYRRLYNGR